jgi:hypothetical protein
VLHYANLTTFLMNCSQPEKLILSFAIISLLNFTSEIYYLLFLLLQHMRASLSASVLKLSIQYLKRLKYAHKYILFSPKSGSQLMLVHFVESKL